MSVHTEIKKLNVNTFSNMKLKQDKITCLTAYDYTSAKIIDNAGIDLILVGDSLGMVMNGFDSTIPVTIDEVIYHTKSVVKACKRAFVVADMPFGSYQVSKEKAYENAIKIYKESGANAIKIEGGAEVAPLIEDLTNMGIACMGHIGLKPQLVNTLGGYKIVREDAMYKMLEDALALEKAGAFAIVIEGTVNSISREVTNALEIPTIGIGAGSECDGQILVFQDVFGLNTDFTPKFVKKYADLNEIITNSTKEYINEVKSKAFPNENNSYK